MIYMKVKKQLNLKDRTLITGIPQSKIVPNKVQVKGNEFNVIGVSYGAKPPFISLEIRKTNIDLENKELETI